MADNTPQNVNIPQNLTKLVELRYSDEPLRRFLISLIVRIAKLEKEVAALQEGS